MILNVPSKYTLSEALDAIPTGGKGIIELGPGVYPSPKITGKTVIIKGSGKDRTFLDGSGVVTDARVSLEWLTIQNGQADFGGGMLLQNSVGKISKVIFKNNLANHGGGLYLQSSALIMKDTEFVKNTAYSNGGGIYLFESSPILEDVEFMGNTAEYGYGGGLYMAFAKPILKKILFKNNKAQGYYEWDGYGYGGGMTLFRSSPVLKHVEFMENSATKFPDIYDIGSL